MITIAVDCMGGDYAPDEIVKGALWGAAEHRVKVLLIGQPSRIEALVAESPYRHVDYEVVEATEVIDMGETPASSIRKKKDASINVATRCVGEGRAQGVVAAGNTGAAMASAIFNMGRVKGIDRPAIAVHLPTVSRPFLVVDAGANADCLPEMLLQFARMGSIFYSAIHGVDNPRVGLLNIGEEPGKGNTFSVSGYKLLEEYDEINFVGNVEARHMYEQHAEVAVCDGFTGNIFLKTSEAVALLMLRMMKDAVNSGIRARAGGLLVKSALKSTIVKKVVDEETGGAILLGVKGLCVIAHGNGKAYAILNALGLAKQAIEQNVVEQMETKVLEGCM